MSDQTDETGSAVGGASKFARPLPTPSTLVWSHATNSTSKLEAALAENSSITAIEADVMMGVCGEDAQAAAGGECSGQELEPIMSHPPYGQSDLSAARFLDRTLFQDGSSGGSDNYRRRCRRHIKLDFKEIDAVAPVLDLIVTNHINNVHQTIFLNADILPGPGVRDPDAVTVRPKGFLGTCLEFIDRIATSALVSSSEGEQNVDNVTMRRRCCFAFSLGYKVDYKSKEPYTRNDANEMQRIVVQNELMSRCGGVVLALNARTLALDPTTFDDFLRRFETLQILAWTGAGEEPISRTVLDGLSRHYEKTGCVERVGFDCDVAK